MDKTPGQVAYEAWEKSRDDRIGLQPSIEAIAHAVIAHVTPHIRAAAIADALIQAKTLEWSDSGGEWMESDFGFQISCKPDGGELRYEAAWGEGDPEEFASFADAKAWCQKQADHFIRDYILPVPRMVWLQCGSNSWHGDACQGKAR